MAASNPESRSRRWTCIPPAIWASALWLFIVNASQVTGQTFYALVRGVGAKEYSDAIVVGSGPVDLGLLVGASMAVSIIHLLIMRKGNVSYWIGLGEFAVFVAGVVGLVASPGVLVLFILGLGGLLTVAFDIREIEDMHNVPQGTSIAFLALFFLLVLSILAILGDVRWIIGGFDGSIPLMGPSWSLSFVDLQLMAILDPVLPEITLAMLFTWILVLFLAVVSESARRWIRGISLSSLTASIPEVSTKRISLAMLGMAIVISIFLGAYPYLHAVNPSSLIIGVDPRYLYSRFMENQSVTAPLSNPPNAYYLSHYGTFVFLQGLAWIGGSNLFALELAYPILAVLLTISTYVFVMEGTENTFAAGVSAIFASTSIQVIAGVNAGFLANWFAISIAFFFFTAVIHAIKSRNRKYLALAYVLSSMVLFIHIWTWALTLGILGIFLVFSLAVDAFKKQLRSKGIELLMLISLLAVGLVVNVVRANLLFGSGIEDAWKTLLISYYPAGVSRLVQNLESTFTMYLLGGLANVVWFTFGAIGTLELVNLKREFGGLLASWLFATSVAVGILGAPIPDSLPVRFLYSLPTQILGSFGFVMVLGTLMAGFRGLKEEALLLFVVALLAILGLSFGFALNNVSFDYRGIPGT